MTDPPDWLPPLVTLDAFDGDWKRYVNAVFAIFHRDFIASKPQFQGKWVGCRQDPIYDGKEAGFWHCVSEGSDEDERLPDLRRCERIGWIRPVIENVGHSTIDVWVSRKGREPRPHLWLGETYLVVLGDRGRYFQLITAHHTDRPHTIRRLRRERDTARND